MNINPPTSKEWGFLFYVHIYDYEIYYNGISI